MMISNEELKLSESIDNCFMKSGPSAGAMKYPRRTEMEDWLPRAKQLEADSSLLNELIELLTEHCVHVSKSYHSCENCIEGYHVRTIMQTSGKDLVHCTGMNDTPRAALEAAVAIWRESK